MNENHAKAASSHASRNPDGSLAHSVTEHPSLRERAETLAQEKNRRITNSTTSLAEASVRLDSAEAMRQKMYELQVHQIELEMQNEELRRTQLELDTASARYFDLYDLAPIGYCTLSEAGLIIEANLTAALLFGAARQKLIGKPISRFICKSAQDVYYFQRNLLLEQGTAVSFDLQMQNASGGSFWTLIAASLDRQVSGAKQIRLVINDITARKASEAVIQEYQARYRNLFASIDEGFCIIKVLFDANDLPIDYSFLEVNPAFEKHTGLVAAKGKRIREVTPEIEPYWINLYGEVALTGVPARVIHEATTLGRWFEVHATRQGDPSDRNVAIIFNNVTDRKIAEMEWSKLDQILQEKNAILERAMAAAEKASQAKSTFLSSMSHELRTPLNAILGFAQMLEIGTPALSALQKRNVDQILKAGWYLLDLINEVLDLSMIESGKVMLSREPVALANLMLECRAMIEPQALKRGIKLNFPRIDKANFVSADRTRFKQVLLNLLLNAIKYNRPNGLVTVEFTLIRPDTLRFGVRDTGAGIAPEQMVNLFQPFNRLGKETGVEEGTGIGLVVTKRLVELMGGSIGVESEVDVGTLFWIELHVSSAPQFSLPDRTADNSDLSEPKSLQADLLATRSLLYVEDNPANLELVEQLVAMRSDLRMFSATDGSVGVEFARSLQPDVILMDINLPGISGIQALQILQADKLTRHIPVIALSANAMPSDIEHGLQLGFFQYLTKPIRVRDFMNTLDAALSFSARTAAQSFVGEHIDFPDPQSTASTQVKAAATDITSNQQTPISKP